MDCAGGTIGLKRSFFFAFPVLTIMPVETLMVKLTEYEHTGIDFYTENDTKQRVLTHPNHEEYE